MNVILACTAVYGVLLIIRLETTEFWIYSGIPAVIHVRPPPSSPLSSPPRIPARPESGGKRVAETRNRISQARIIYLKNESG